MSVSSVASSFSQNIIASQGGVQSAGRRDLDGDRDGGGRRVGGAGRAGGGFAQAIMHALSQSGLTGATQAAGRTSGAKDADGDDDGTGQGSANASTAGQALNAFMHTLFQAMRSAGETPGTSAPTSTGSTTPASASASAAPPARSRYGNPATDLESLLQKLGAGDTSVQSGSGGSSAIDDLKSAFEKLVSALGANGSNGTASQGTAPDLRTFLQNLQKDLPSEGGSRVPATTGSVFRASA